MPDVTLLAIFAVGSGISIGWVLHAWHLRVRPEGVARMAESCATQVAIAKAESEKQVARAEQRHADVVSMLQAELARAHAQSDHLCGLLARGAAAPLPAPVRDRALTPEQSAARATGNGVNPETVVRDKLLELGFAADIATRVSRGDTDNLPPDQLLDELTVGINRADSGAEPPPS